MDKSAVRAIVDTHIDGYMRGFGIPHWRIVVVYGHLEGEANWEQRAEVQYKAEYERATIWIDPEALEDEAEVLTTLRHELFHVLSWPYALYRKAGWCHSIEAGSSDDHREDALWQTAQEQFVRNMERLWIGMCEMRVIAQKEAE